MNIEKQKEEGNYFTLRDINSVIRFLTISDILILSGFGLISPIQENENRVYYFQEIIFRFYGEGGKQKRPCSCRPYYGRQSALGAGKEPPDFGGAPSRV